MGNEKTIIARNKCIYTGLCIQDRESAGMYFFGGYCKEVYLLESIDDFDHYHDDVQNVTIYSDTF